MWIAFGISALIVALALAAVLFRLRGTLGAMQELLDTTSDEMKETLPEVRETIGSVNDIAMGVRPGEDAFQRELEAILDRKQGEIRRILEEYGVPLVGPPQSAAER